MIIILLIIGFVLLVKGADYFVEGTSALALHYKVPQIVIGLTVVAFGTSAPELVVSIMSSLKGQNEIILGNIIGSNLFNVLLILGITGLINPLEVKKTTVWREIPFLFVITLISFFLLNDKLFSDSIENILNFADSIILLILFVFYLIYNFVIIQADSTSEYEICPLSYPKIIIYSIGGLIALIIGGKMVVENAVDIAEYFHVSKKVIGLTIVALGTSLPELMTSVVAVLKKKTDIAVGNVVGSNIFNLLFVMSCSGIIKTINYQKSFNLDFALLIFASFLLFIFMFTMKRHRLDRFESALFVFIYIAYVILMIINS